MPVFCPFCGAGVSTAALTCAVCGHANPAAKINATLDLGVSPEDFLPEEVLRTFGSSPSGKLPPPQTARSCDACSALLELGAKFCWSCGEAVNHRPRPKLHAPSEKVVAMPRPAPEPAPEPAPAMVFASAPVAEPEPRQAAPRPGRHIALADFEDEIGDDLPPPPRSQDPLDYLDAQLGLKDPGTDPRSAHREPVAEPRGTRRAWAANPRSTHRESAANPRSAHRESGADSRSTHRESTANPRGAHKESGTDSRPAHKESGADSRSAHPEAPPHRRERHLALADEAHVVPPDDADKAGPAPIDPFSVEVPSVAPAWVVPAAGGFALFALGIAVLVHVFAPSAIPGYSAAEVDAKVQMRAVEWLLAGLVAGVVGLLAKR